MATLDDSPSHFAGQPWSEWAKTVPSPPYSDSGGESAESKVSDDSDSMKLRIEDSSLFGVCPSQDEFYLIKCEKCNKVIKPQAFSKHLRQRHAESSVTSVESNNISINRSSKLSPSKSSSLKVGLTVPTKASMKEIPPSISNAQKMGAALNARLKGSEKNKRSHTMPVVKVERMKMDMKKMSPPIVESVQDSIPTSMTNGVTCAKKIRRTPTPPQFVESKTITTSPIFNAATKTLPPNFKSTFTPRPLSPPKSVTHVLFLTNTTPSVSIATPTLTTATTSCVTTTMTTTLLSPQVSAAVTFNSINMTKPCKTNIDIKNLQNLGMDGEDEQDEKDLIIYRDQNLNSLKVEDKSFDEGYSSSLHSFNEPTLNNNARTTTITGQNMTGLNDSNFNAVTVSNVTTFGNRTHFTLENSSLKSHLLVDKKDIILTNCSDTSLNSLSSTSLNSLSSSTLNSSTATGLSSLSNTSLNGSGSNTSIANAGSKKKYPRVLFGKADKLIPCKDREYDPDKHCGVVADDGKPCTRSLTCKTHAVSRRRKVIGRRKPFDDLLKEHRAAKEILLKQKAELKQAAALGLAKPSALQTGTPTVTDIPFKPGQVKTEKENSSHYPGLLESHLAIFKPVKPNSIHSHRSSLSSLHSFSTPSPKDDPLKPPDFPERADDDDGQDSNYLPYHPRPAAMCTFGARSHNNNTGKRCYTFNRKTDVFRSAFLSALEKHLNPSPTKKRCLESNLPKEAQVNMNSKDPYDFQMLDASGIPQVQHFNTVLNSVDSSSVKHKPKTSGSGKHKQKDSAGAKSPGHAANMATNSAIINAIGNSAKRRRSGSSVTTTCGTLPTNLRTVSSNSTMQTVGAPTIMGNITLNSQSTPLIAIPNMNLSSATLSQISANLNSKQPKNNIFKDFGLVLTGLDGSIVNGQYLNITAAPQTLDDKGMQQTHIINKNNKIMNLDQLKALSKSNLIPVTQFFVDSGVQPGTTVLAPVSLASMSNNSVVSIACNVSQSQATPVIASHTLKPGGVSSHVTLTSLPNGILSTTDKSNPRPQSVVHHKPKSIHPQHGILTNAVIASSNNQQMCAGQIFTTQLAQLQVKPMNITKSGATGELSMQPVSLTFPIAGLRVPGQQHSTQTFYITSTNDSQQHDIQQQQVSNSPSMS